MYSSLLIIYLNFKRERKNLSLFRDGHKGISVHPSLLSSIFLKLRYVGGVLSPNCDLKVLDMAFEKSVGN